jgi:hypothetical protein
VKSYHHHALKDSGDSSFQRAFRSYQDIITGFHFLTPKEEIFVLETRCDDRKKATKKLDRLLRGFPATLHILGNRRKKFNAPRLYCCFDRLLKTVEVPIVIEEMLRLEGLYFRSDENSQLFSVAQKFNDLIGSRTLCEAATLQAFPTYREIKVLIRRAVGLYVIPLPHCFPVHPRPVVNEADFGDPPEEIPSPPLQFEEGLSLAVITQSHPIQVTATPAVDEVPLVKERPRLTRFYLARPQSQREVSVRELAKAGKKKQQSASTVIDLEPKAPSTPKPKSGRRRRKVGENDLRRSKDADD